MYHPRTLLAMTTDRSHCARSVLRVLFTCSEDKEQNSELGHQLCRNVIVCMHFRIHADCFDEMRRCASRQALYTYLGRDLPQPRHQKHQWSLPRQLRCYSHHVAACKVGNALPEAREHTMVLIGGRVSCCCCCSIRTSGCLQSLVDGPLEVLAAPFATMLAVTRAITMHALLLKDFSSKM